MTLVLTPEELVELTGRMRHRAQAQALTAMGIRYRVRPDGSLAVLRVHVIYETTEDGPASPQLRL